MKKSYFKHGTLTISRLFFWSTFHHFPIIPDNMDFVGFVSFSNKGAQWEHNENNRNIDLVTVEKV